MKIAELIKLIGIYEPIRVINSEFEEVEKAMAKDLSPNILNKNIKSLYADKSVISIIIR